MNFKTKLGGKIAGLMSFSNFKKYLQVKKFTQ